MKKYEYLPIGSIVYLIRDNRFLKVEVDNQISDSGGESSVVILTKKFIFWKTFEAVKRYQLMSSDDISVLLQERIINLYNKLK